MSGPRIAVLIYTMYGHIGKMAEAVKRGVEADGGSATILQVPETLPEDVLEKMSAPPKPNYPIAKPTDLLDYDGYLIGISTRYGGWPAQFKTFWDATGQLWASGALAGKFAGAFVCSAGPGGGQESTYYSILSTLVHHGIIFVPLGYAHTSGKFPENLTVTQGGSPFGAGTFASLDGSRQPTEIELEVASIQGRQFHSILNKYVPHPVSNGGSVPKATTTDTSKVSDEGKGAGKSKEKKRRSVIGRIVHQLKP